MDPLSIAASSFGIVGAIAKASISILEFSQHARDAAEDLQRVSSELQALSAILDPLARNVLRAPRGTVPAALAQQLGSSLDGCALVVARIETAVEKYQRDGAWTRTKWVMFGRGDVDKLRSSLEAYKMALSLGLHVVSMAVEASIKDDTGAIRSHTQALRQETAAIQVNTEEILARVMSLRHGARPEVGSRTRQWVESMAVLSSYAESSYQDTVVDPGEQRDAAANDNGDGQEPVREKSPALDPIPEFDRVELSDEGEQVGGIKRSSGSDEDGSPRVTSVSVEVPVRQRYVETEDNPVGAFSSLGTGAPRDGSLENKKGVDETLGNAVRTTIQRNSKNGALDVVISLDIGASSAAVAWMTPQTPAQVIRQWPGGEGVRVPMQVVHDEDENVLRWGFQCGQRPESVTDGSDLSLTLFLRQLHVYIRQTIISALGWKLSDWAEKGVEFHVTAPIRMRDMTPQAFSGKVQEVKDKMRGGGIGTGGPRHCAVVGLTETEAAATAVLLRLPPAPVSEPRSIIMLTIGRHHATLLLGERSREGATIHFSYSVSTPTLSFHITKMVSTWLKDDDPEFWESLGPDGVGRFLQGPGYREIMDALHADAPLHESYRLRFDGLRGFSRHGAFDIDDGTIKLDRTHVQLISDSLVDEISNLVIDALVNDSARATQQVAWIPRTIITVDTAETPKHLAKRIMEDMEKKSEIVYAAYRAAYPRTSIIVAADPGSYEKTFALKVERAPLTGFGESTLAAVEGLLIHRNAWIHMREGGAGSSQFPYLRLNAALKFPGLMSPRVYARAWMASSSGSAPRPISLRRTNAPGPDTWSLTPARITRYLQVWDYRFPSHDRHDRKRLCLELCYSYGSDWLGGDRPKLCTAVWELEPWKFRSRTWKTKWWGLGANWKRGTLEFAIHVSFMHPFKTGPVFQLVVPDDNLLEMPESVEWHCEPPFLVWPAESKEE